MNIAIVTGASAGLGRAFVPAILDTCADVEEIWLIARRRTRLEELAAVHASAGIRFRIIEADLTDPADLDAIASQLDQEKPQVRLLINDAGMEIHGPFASQDRAAQMRMVDLNARAPMALMSMTLPFMDRGGRIINVCSVCSFMPNPDILAYSATKSFLYFLSRGLREELRGTGINVLALCPGNMSTEMNGASAAHATSNDSGLVARLPFLDLSRVAHETLRRAAAGRGVYTPGAVYRGYQVLAKIVPHNIAMRFARV